MRLREFRTEIGQTVFVNPATVSIVANHLEDPALTVIYTTERTDSPELWVKCSLEETVRRLELSDEDYRCEAKDDQIAVLRDRLEAPR